MAIWDAIRIVVLFVGWPGLIIVSAYALAKAFQFYKGLRHSAPGLLVMLMIVGWVFSVAGAALVATMFMQQTVSAAPIVLPAFVMWAGSLVIIVWVVQKWGAEAERLDSYYSDIERLERMKSGFINHVAHELNTPMTPLRMQIALLENEASGPLTEKQARAVDRIGRNVERLGRLVEHVLVANRLQAGRLQLHTVPEPLLPVVESIDPALSVKAESEPVVLIDKRHVAYCVQVLLEELRVRQEDATGLHVRTANDHGQVIIEAPHHTLREAQFQNFHDPEAAEKAEGIALALGNIRGIVEAHHGRVAVLPQEICMAFPLAR